MMGRDGDPMIDRDTALRLAADHGARHLPELGRRTWRPTRFDGGWLLTAEGEDLRWRTGVACLVVRDDGTVHGESSSLPPGLLMQRHRPPRGDDDGGRHDDDDVQHDTEEDGG